MASEIGRYSICTDNVQFVFANLACEIMAYLSLLDVLSLAWTSRCLRAHLHPHLARQFHRLLRSIFPNPEQFRDVLRRTASVISGSTALSFAVRDDGWAPRDMDLFVPHGLSALVLRRHLLSQGFQLRTFNGGTQAHYYKGGVKMSSITRFERTSQVPGGTSAYIDVIESANASPLEPITSFHSTLVMNYLTADSVVLLYPRLTFQREAVLRAPIHGQELWVAKYKARGYDFSNNHYLCAAAYRSRRSDQSSAAHNVCVAACPHKPRTSIDHHTCRLQFSPVPNHDLNAMSDGLAHYNEWRLSPT